MAIERWLLDTNILLRLLWLTDEDSLPVEQAFRVLPRRPAEFFFTLQNASEYWNVCTRPNKERGGLDLSPTQAASGLALLETQATLLSDTAEVYARWKRLTAQYEVRGVQVHDAKLVAAMLANKVEKVLTLNAGHFRRYGEIEALLPRELL